MRLGRLWLTAFILLSLSACGGDDLLTDVATDALTIASQGPQNGGTETGNIGSKNIILDLDLLVNGQPPPSNIGIPKTGRVQCVAEIDMTSQLQVPQNIVTQLLNIGGPTRPPVVLAEVNNNYLTVNLATFNIADQSRIYCRTYIADTNGNLVEELITASYQVTALDVVGGDPQGADPLRPRGPLGP